MPKKFGQSFIVRIWQEPREVLGAPVEWRGYISNLLTNEHRYFKNLEEIIAFIKTYLDKVPPSGE